MSKITKLKNNPKLFFIDVLKNRKRDIRNIVMTSREMKSRISYKLNSQNQLSVATMVGIDKKDHYVISVVIPAFNSSESLPLTLDSILAQDIDINTVEVLIINDGSTDNTLDVASLYNEIMPSIKIINKDNGGVSSARNLGIKNAKGEFVMFLDSDDTLSSNTLSSIVNFFKAHKEEIDILTYPLYYVRNGIAKSDHFRYKNILTSTGVYDIDKDPFICQTTINVCVKNNPKILFNEDMIIQEDQDFNFKSLLRTRKIGFVKEAGYFYKIDSGSLSGTKNNPLYSFELFCNYYLEMLVKNSGDKYIQSLFLYNLQWRLKSDQLFPYFLCDNDYNQAVNKISSLINGIDSELILNFPNFDFFHKFYILKLGRKDIQFQPQENQMLLIHNDNIIHKEKEIEIIVNKIKIIGGSLKFIGVLKSVSFLFYNQKPKLFVIADGNKFELRLSDASESYYKTKVKVARFFSFSLEEKISNIKNFKFFVEVGGFLYGVKYYFNTFSSINTRIKRSSFNYKKYKLSFSENEFHILPNDNQDLGFNNLPVQHYTVKKLARETCTGKNDIWLYYDCKGVMIDNGLFQFIYDSRFNDGISRYFIWNNDINSLPEMVPDNLKNRFIPFGSMLHKILILNASKILTSFIEPNNIYPFPNKDISYYSDMFHFEIIYLQHGILHASMPHKYTQEKLLFDKIVVSSHFEIDNFVKKYNVSPKDLILSGMSRFGILDKTVKPSNKILLAPSWRSYLINNIGGSWEQNIEKFKKSKYYKEIKDFLSSPILNKFLLENNLYLDFQLHPIFQCYKGEFYIDNSRINIIDSNSNKEDYALFITDFSSFVFDFAFLERPVIYFVPDLPEFRSGMASYRELDLSFDNGFGRLTQTSHECLSEILRMYNDGFVGEDIFVERMKNFFIPMENPANIIYKTCLYGS